jgi:hypothetical protein
MTNAKCHQVFPISSPSGTRCSQASPAVRAPAFTGSESRSKITIATSVKVASRTLTVTAVVVLALASAGCGSGAGTTIVHIGSTQTITKGALAHWLPIVAIRDYELQPKSRVPDWVIPDPPHYSRCIAHLAQASPPQSVPASVAALRRECHGKYQQLRQQVLGFLISAHWLIAEGEARGLRPTSTEIKARFTNRVLRNEFRSLSAFKSYAALTGETVADQLFRARIKVITEKIESQFASTKASSPSQRQEALTAWGESLPRRWASKTRCSVGYVVPDCSEYNGPKSPQLII